MKFLVLIIDRFDGHTLAEYNIDAIDWYYARSIGIDKYVKEGHVNKNFYADSMEIE